MFIDFYTEIHSTLVKNVTNKVYFQAWATYTRADVYEFSRGSVIAELADGSIEVLNGNLRTEHRGKGQFTFINKEEYSKIYVQIENNAVIKRYL